jgi:hypothetical protein
LRGRKVNVGKVWVLYAASFTVRVMWDVELCDGALEVGVETRDEHGEGESDKQNTARKISSVSFGGYVKLAVPLANSRRSIIDDAC